MPVSKVRFRGRGALAAALLALAVLLAAMLAACGGGRQAPSTSPAGPGGAAPATPAAPAPSGAPATGTDPAPGAAAAPAAPVTLVWGRGADAKSLDPINVTDGESLKVTTQVYETLVRYQPGVTEVEPALATAWQVSPDGREWTFTLRQGVRFHDGTPFDAAAVKLNFDRWRRTDHPARGSGNFAYYGYMFGGFDDQSVIRDVVAVDPHTVRFVLSEPQAPFLYNLAMSPFGLASPQALQQGPAGLANHPVGTGPFRFVEWKKNDRIVLTANDAYWDGRPQVDRLIYRSVPDNNARLLALQAGELDVMDGIDPAFLPILKGLDAFSIVERPPMNVGYLAMNVQKQPFDNPLVRQAINHAINKRELIQAFFGGMAAEAVSPLPPAVWGSTSDVTRYDYDPDRARALLAEAGYPDGFETDLWMMPVPRPYMPQPGQIAVAIQGYLKEVGIHARIVTYDWGTYLDKTGRGEHTMALLGWIGDNGDPDNFLYVLLSADTATPVDAGNIAFYRNPELNDLLLQAQRIADPAQRTQLYHQAQRIIAADVPWVPLVHARVPIAVRRGIEGYVPSPVGAEPLGRVTFRK